MKRAEIIVSLFLLLCSILLIGGSLKLNIGWGLSGPESGFFPFILSLLLGIFSLILLLGFFFKGDTKTHKAFFHSSDSIISILKVGIPAAVFVVLVPYLGIYLSGAIYLGFFMRYMGSHKWLQIIPICILFPVAVYLLFEKWFLISLPKGILENLFYIF